MKSMMRHEGCSLNATERAKDGSTTKSEVNKHIFILPYTSKKFLKLNNGNS